MDCRLAKDWKTFEYRELVHKVQRQDVNKGGVSRGLGTCRSFLRLDRLAETNILLQFEKCNPSVGIFFGTEHRVCDFEHTCASRKP